MGKAVQKTRGLLHYELVHGQESRPLDFANIRKYAVVVMLQLVSFFAMNCSGFNVIRIRAGKELLCFSLLSPFSVLYIGMFELVYRYGALLSQTIADIQGAFNNSGI